MISLSLRWESAAIFVMWFWYSNSFLFIWTLPDAWSLTSFSYCKAQMFHADQSINRLFIHSMTSNHSKIPTYLHKFLHHPFYLWCQMVDPYIGDSTWCTWPVRWRIHLEFSLKRMMIWSQRSQRFHTNYRGEQTRSQFNWPPERRSEHRGSIGGKYFHESTGKAVD
jgi:hypothetical protein